MTMFKTNFCISTTAIHLLAMSPAKKTSENKDYCKRYREKNREKYRKNDAERKRAQRVKVKLQNPELYELKKKEERERKQLSRLRKKFGLINQSPVTSESTVAAANNDAATPSTSFSTKQAKARSISRAEKALPKSPRKKNEILGSLAKKYKLRIVMNKKKTGRKATELTEEEKQWIVVNLDSADLTYVNPGRKDHVYIGKKDGERQYCQKRYLLWNMRDLLNILNGNEVAGSTTGAETFAGRFEKPLSFSLLYNFIRNQKQLIYNQNIPQGSCLCEVCENSCLLAKGINKYANTDLPTNPHDIVEENCCDSTDDHCMLGLCEDCSIPKKFNHTDEETLSNDNTDSSDGETDGNQVTYCKWTRVEKKVQKVTVTEERSDCVESWKESVKSLKQHIFRKRSQVASLIEAKSNLQEGQLLMQVDYSESYKNAEQNEIQSAYFGHSCFSVFTACCYYRAEEGELMKYPVTITSESSDHSRIAAFSCVNKIIKLMEEKIKSINNVIVWSDGMGAQFRSRFVFMLLSTVDHAINLEWHYNEAHHGKGPMDGVGGTIKNLVFRAVKSGKVSVSDPEEFVKAPNDIVPSIRSIYMPIVDILEEPLEVANAPAIPETLQVRKVVREITKENIPLIKFFKLSRDDTPAYTQYYRPEKDPQVCG